MAEEIFEFRWVVPPSTLGRAVEQYGARVFVAIKAVADFTAQRLQGDARNDAPWQDRTGNARSGLFGVAEQVAQEIVEIYLAHTMKYGLFLELAHGGRYAVIIKTMERDFPELTRMLDEIFAG